MLKINQSNLQKKKKIILFISPDYNYFIDNSGSFYRMYQNLIFFHNHKDFNVIVLHPDRERKKEKKKFKKNIRSYHYREIRFLGNRIVHLTDFNPFFISRVIKILKKHHIDLIHVDYVYGINILRFITKIPVVYNAYNVEAIYYKEVGSHYYKIPIFLRFFYAKYIYFLEKYAVKFATAVNAFSLDDKKRFVKIYNNLEKKIFINNMGYKKEIFDNPIKQEEARKKLKINKNKFIVIFHGSYFNNDANEEAYNIIKEQISPRIKDNEILFLFAGVTPFKNDKNLKFLGFVDDLREFLYAADIAIVPIFRGSGIRIKMIDYLSAKIPMITTRQAALGLNFKNNVHGYIVNNKKPIENMIEKIFELKNNLMKIKEFKNNIKNLLEENYNWDSILKVLVTRYREIILTNK